MVIEDKNLVLAATCLLLSVADADEVLEDGELHIIEDIIKDFFELPQEEATGFVQSAQNKLKAAAGLFEFGQILNTKFNHQEKLEFIECVFEVAYADGDLHYLEHHTIKKIAHILHIERDEIIAAKAEIKAYLD